MPILFNLYATELTLEKDPVRQSILDTIKCYLQITDLGLINTYLLHAVKKFEEYSKLCEESQKSHTTTDANNNKTSSKPKAVQFDFALREDVPEVKAVDTSKNQLNFFAKYGFLDLIAVLGRYSNETNVLVIYQLAIDGIEVRIIK